MDLRRRSHGWHIGPRVDARAIASELGCRHVVEGSVRKIGDRVRVTVLLIDALNDRHVWAERFDRRLEDAFQLQDEICDQVVVAIQSRIGKESPDQAPVVRGPAEPAARPRRFRWSRWTIPALLALIAADDYAGAFGTALRVRSSPSSSRTGPHP